MAVIVSTLTNRMQLSPGSEQDREDLTVALPFLPASATVDALFDPVALVAHIERIDEPGFHFRSHIPGYVGRILREALQPIGVHCAGT